MVGTQNAHNWSLANGQWCARCTISILASNQLSPDFGHLFLTSSIDWTIKLWSLKDAKPLYFFEDNSDYLGKEGVYDDMVNW
ncbi:GD20029 [Drosophila simulans]|uniref:GD20029 n=1 Tax=Drosophila simulans TaxID=7240 RepID=B4R1R5_DROSI|nr:GD20029 [Drosophila simulans]